MDAIFGASGMVGEHIANQLQGAVLVSRHGRPGWVKSDILKDPVKLPAKTLFCAMNARTFAQALPELITSATTRVVVISSSSVFTKLDSNDENERFSIAELVAAERSIIKTCDNRGIAWTILRPTLIYKEGRDRNVTRIANLIRRYHFMPLYGHAGGLRQPVHAEDLANGAIHASRSSKAENRAYVTAGNDVITYREMVGRIFDAVSVRRLMISVHPYAWKAAVALVRQVYPDVTMSMAERMTKDLAFDCSDATTDFGWTARDFRPLFDR